MTPCYTSLRQLPFGTGSPDIPSRLCRLPAARLILFYGLLDACLCLTRLDWFADIARIPKHNKLTTGSRII
jgi:hypothetical protein